MRSIATALIFCALFGARALLSQGVLKQGLSGSIDAWQKITRYKETADRIVAQEDVVAPTSNWSGLANDFRTAAQQVREKSAIAKTMPQIPNFEPHGTGPFGLCGTSSERNRILIIQRDTYKQWQTYAATLDSQISRELEHVQESDERSDELRVMMDKIVLIPNIGTKFVADWFSVAVDLPHAIGDLRSSLKVQAQNLKNLRALAKVEVDSAEEGLSPAGQAQWVRQGRCPGPQ